MSQSGTLTLEASDVSKQTVAKVGDVPIEYSVGELIDGLLAEMDLPQNDVEGRPLTYHGLLEREGRHLHASETVGDALQNEDRIVLQPELTAGRG